MCRPHETLYTKQQVERLLSTWNSSQAVPRKGQKVVVSWCAKYDLDVDLAEIELTDKPATYGGKLYRVTMSSRSGRAFDASVQEAHVKAFIWHRFEQQRQAKLAKFREMEVKLAAETNSNLGVC